VGTPWLQAARQGCLRGFWSTTPSRPHVQFCSPALAMTPSMCVR
jgi:hypothetical protein